MIPNEEKEGWHYLAVKKLLLRGITLKHHGDFYCLYCLHSFRKEKVHKNKDFCGIVMPSEKDNILEFNLYMKSDKKKTDVCANNPENSSTTKISEHIPCGYSMSIAWAFHHIESKHALYLGKYCMQKFCESLREHTKNIINFEKKKMLPLTKEELESHQDTKVCYICGKRILKKLSKSINYQKVRDHCHYTGKIEAQHIVFVI